MSAPAVVLIASFLLAGCRIKNEFIFYPHKHIVSYPSAVGLAYEDVSFKTGDDVMLNGWWVPAQSARATLLFCHGNGGNISFLLDTIVIFHSMNLNTMVFDYRGYGRSLGTPTEEGTYRDVDAAWNYLLKVKKISPDEVILIGRSLGGPIAAWLAQKYKPGALILESTFTRIADVADFHYPFAPGRIIFGNAYNTENYIARVTCPVLVVHSPDDDIVPYMLGTRIFEHARQPKEFLIIHGLHNSGFIESMGIYKAGLNRFISRYFY
ncbi:MAG: hypothetical protein A2W19_10175 [Spirochaetes bacterium RBG_16_49_21]|nr:MAG: hypothetical protein A2W19_10175 [Spirochaetes bacterium RBG_16_49_21]